MPITWSESSALEIIAIQTHLLTSSLKAAATYSLLHIPGKPPLSARSCFDFFLLLVHNLPGWHRSLRSELLGPALTCGSFLELGPRVTVMEAFLYTLLWPLHGQWKSCRLWWNCSFVFVWEAAEDSNFFHWRIMEEGADNQLCHN